MNKQQSNESGKTQKNKLLFSMTLVILSLTSIICSTFCMVQVQNIQNIIAQSEIQTEQEFDIDAEDLDTNNINNSSISISDLNAKISLSTSNVMMESYEHAEECLMKENANEMALLTLTAKVTNNTSEAFPIGAIEPSLHWKVLNGEIEVGSTGELISQGGNCIQGAAIMTYEKYYGKGKLNRYVPFHGGIDKIYEFEDAIYDKMLLSGGTMEFQVYIGIRRNADMNNLTLLYEKGDIRFSAPLRVDMETIEYYNTHSN